MLCYWCIFVRVFVISLHVAHTWLPLLASSIHSCESSKELKKKKETKQKQNYNAIIMCWHFGRVYFYIVPPFPLTSLNQIGVFLLYTFAHIAMCVSRSWPRIERDIDLNSNARKETNQTKPRQKKTMFVQMS